MTGQVANNRATKRARWFSGAALALAVALSGCTSTTPTPEPESQSQSGAESPSGVESQSRPVPSFDLPLTDIELSAAIDQTFGTFERVLLSGDRDQTGQLPGPAGVITGDVVATGFLVEVLDDRGQVLLALDQDDLKLGPRAFGLDPSASKAEEYRVTTNNTYNLTIVPLSAYGTLPPGVAADAGSSHIWLYGGVGEQRRAKFSAPGSLTQSTFNEHTVLYEHTDNSDSGEVELTLAPGPTVIQLVTDGEWMFVDASV